jgi:hypothetical protein
MTSGGIKVGLDFDNTLIRYDGLFHALAVEQKLISPELKADKTVIRDHLRTKGRDEDFTLLQGEVYGSRIRGAVAAPGMLSALIGLQALGVELVIVSHKTATPFKGPAYDLLAAARDWLTLQGFFSPEGLGWSQEQVFFEPTKERKAQRIIDLGCTHYVDDLPEILAMLPETIKRILYSPSGESTWERGPVMKTWEELGALVTASHSGQ